MGYFAHPFTTQVLNQTCSVLEVPYRVRWTSSVDEAMSCKALVVVDNVARVFCGSDPVLTFAIAVAGLSVCSAKDFLTNKPDSQRCDFGSCALIDVVLYELTVV